MRRATLRLQQQQQQQQGQQTLLGPPPRRHVLRAAAAVSLTPSSRPPRRWLRGKMAAAAQARPQQQQQQQPSAELEETGAPAPPPHTRESTLALLRACGVPFELREHPSVMTADAMRQALQEADGGGEQGSDALVVKSLLLRDKKKRLYLLSTVEGTRVDLKALAARLGASGGLSFAPEHLLMPALGVGPGCATPLAVCNARAAGVPLLVDARLREPGVRFWAHPCGCNDASVLLDADGLETVLLHACGRSVAAYIDPCATPSSQPGDLAHVAASAVPVKL